MVMIQPKLYSRLFVVKFQPMLRKFFSKLHTWKAVSSSTKRLSNALPIELPRPNSQRR